MIFSRLFIQFITILGVRLDHICGLMVAAVLALNLACIFDFILDLSDLVDHVHGLALGLRIILLSLLIALRVSLVRLVLIPVLCLVRLTG